MYAYIKHTHTFEHMRKLGNQSTMGAINRMVIRSNNSQTMNEEKTTQKSQIGNLVVLFYTNCQWISD